ncbi:MAG TPA: Asp-tRNA(Asn)/Glu-tRNA(Gln) amidotransferase subunit GatB [Acidimicrobiia bacterium]
MSWESVIGIETHVELSTQSKMFCGCAVGFGAEPNTSVCPVCLGLPGALPVPNERAIESIALIGLALNCEVARNSVFHRKNYFYADLPKNYQISQYDLPVCKDGWLEIEANGERRRVRIERAHMEEDTGKSIHTGEGGRIHTAGSTLLDFNRSGVPLVEVVSRPDLPDARTARAYAQQLRDLVGELGVSDARMEEGSIRFDANVSVRPEGQDALGTKVEIKNMNSFRSLEAAIDFEIARQIGVIEAGGELIQETRHWDEEAGVTQGMRTKEGSSDYRYFAEPDLVPLAIGPEQVAALRTSLPETPSQRHDRYVGMGLSSQAASVMSASEPAMRRLFEGAVEARAPAAAAASWVSGEVTALLRRTERSLESSGISSEGLAALVAMVDSGQVSSSAAKEVLAAMQPGDQDPQALAERLDLLQISDSSALAAQVAEVVAANADARERYRAGETKVLGFLVGQVMKATGGKADPAVVSRLLVEQLS